MSIPANTATQIQTNAHAGTPQTEADRLQHQAADPQQSVWVGASAGSGKTKVLTDRVLRLLLPRPDGADGTPPEKILCLTFTRAGAAEMAVRINDALTKWVVTDEETLHQDLQDLLGHAPSAREKEQARRLFARVIDAQGGLKILTIHSFCQSILGRFPIEAKLPPHFKLVDERDALDIQKNALDRVILRAADTGLADALTNLSKEKAEESLLDLLRGLMGERQMFNAAMIDPDATFAKLCTFLGVRPDDTRENLIAAAMASPAINKDGLIEAAAFMAKDSGKTMQERAPRITATLNAAPDTRPEHYLSYKKVFLTNDDVPYAKLLSAGIMRSRPDLSEVMEKEAARLAQLEDRIRACRCARLSYDLLRLGGAMLHHYSQEKAARAALDYDDLITFTLDLLSGRSMDMTQADVAPWVMLKLDQGIDHILVDEAQDTNPDQWKIIRALTSEFFSGEGVRPDINRTIFAVGDEKQSIFGFQRAAPEKFRETESQYKQEAEAAQKRFASIPMTMSFRSTGPVLALTDAVFDILDPWKALGLPEGTRVEHSSNRLAQAGHVELWPLIEAPPINTPDPWTMPIAVESREGAEAKLAKRIATSIKGWIGNDILQSHGRPVQAGDIMILVKSRGTLVEHLVRALKSAGVAVSGVDRMELGKQIAVQDLLAAAQFALLPEDDLALAGLLKSPLIGLSEERLYDIAANREDKSLWAAAKQSLPGTATEWLSALIARAGTIRPYEFFSDLLHLDCPAGQSGLKAITGRLGTDSLDPLEEFLNTTLDYEADHIPSLQKFMAWQDSSNKDIKREMENAGDKVRIMTVHASKGLQAPIVILPDTIHTAQSISKIDLKDRIIWTPDGPLWSPRGDDDCAAYKHLVAEKKIKLAEEYRRLLYVALTRAGDRLYVAGCIKGPRNTPAPDCWYNMIRNGFQRLESRSESFIGAEGDSELTFRITTQQETKPDKAGKDQDIKNHKPACHDWSWMDRKPPEEESPPRPFTPSRPSDPEPDAQSPRLTQDNQYRFRRGNVTHALLQFLPPLPMAEWERAATIFVQKQKDLPESVQAGIVREVMDILQHPDFAPLFGPGSIAEVPVTALVGDKLISGQIDRLLIGDTEIMIVDYKTNRPPPADEKDIPVIYRTQLRAYRDALAKIYPDHRIRTALLWTDGPRLVEVKT